MNQRMFEELARQRQAEIARRATRGLGRRPTANPRADTACGRTRRASQVPAGAVHIRGARPSLRARTGWKLVDLGLRLAVQHHSRPAARTAGS